MSGKLRQAWAVGGPEDKTRAPGIIDPLRLESGRVDGGIAGAGDRIHRRLQPAFEGLFAQRHAQRGGPEPLGQRRRLRPRPLRWPVWTAYAGTVACEGMPQPLGVGRRMTPTTLVFICTE